MGSTVQLKYEELRSAYWNNLTTVLRGFSVGPNLDFLDSWVPEDDIVQSIVGILDAAFNRGFDGILLELSPETMNGVDPEEVREASGPFGTVEFSRKGESWKLGVRFGNALSKPVISPKRVAVPTAPQKVAVSTRPSSLEPSSEPHATMKDGGILPLDYAAALQKLITSFPHDKIPQPEANLERVTSAEQGVELIALVDPHNHRIRKVGFAGSMSAEQRCLAELLCRTIENKPIQDASDHALIDMEYRLFGRERPRGSRGIVMPENSSSAFELSARLVRGLMSAYRACTGYQNIGNTFDPPVSQEWLHLTGEDRIAQIQRAIDEHPGSRGVKVVRLEGLQRFVVEFDGIASGAGSTLLGLEKHVKNRVEPTLQLYLQPRPDQNKLRRLNDTKGQADEHEKLG